MNKSCTCILYCLFFLFSTFAYGQKKQDTLLLDSINYYLHGEMTLRDMRKCSELLLRSYYYNPNNSANLQYSNTLVRLARKNADIQYGVYAYSVAMFIEQDPRKAAIASDSCLWYIENSDDNLTRFIGYSRLGDNNGQDAKAIEYFLKALDEIKGKKHYPEEVNIYGSISTFYRDKNEYPQAIKYAKMALQSAELSDDVVIIREALNDIGVMYYEKDTISSHIAEEYYKKALNTFTNDSEKSKYTIYPKLLVNLSTIYQRKQDYDAALKCINEAYLFAVEEDDTELLIECYLNMGFIYEKKNELESSEKYFLKAIGLLPELPDNLGGNYDSSLPFMLNYYLADTYYKMRRYDKASMYYAKAEESYRTQHSTSEMYESRRLESRYKTEEEEIRIKILNQEVKYERIQKYLSVAIIFLLGTALFFGYKLLKEKLKIAKQKEQVLQSETQLLAAARDQSEINSKLLKEQATQQEYQKRLSIREAERISKELEEKELLIRHRSYVLEEAGQHLIAEPALKPFHNLINSFIVQEKRVDHSFEEAETISQSAFYKDLQEKSSNNLTPLDFKYCNYIAMKITSKEMADLLHVELQTVRVSKYRLKQKLKLGKDEDLNQFIEEVYTKYNMP